MLLKPLEYRDPARLLRISVEDPNQGVQDMGFTQFRREQMSASARSFDAWVVFIATEDVTLSGQAAPEALKAARVSANFLHILGVKPLLGRSFLTQEDRAGGPAVAMVSAALWSRRFGADATLAGKALTLNATRYAIVGVLPSGFQFPHEGVDVWLTRPCRPPGRVTTRYSPPSSSRELPALGLRGTA